MLFVIWLAAAGYDMAFLVAVGAIATAAATWSSLHMSGNDSEGHPARRGPRVSVICWPWELREILEPAWTVTPVVIAPCLPLRPTMTRIRFSQRNPFGNATYANSISLAPGRITTSVTGHDLTVHALVKEGEDDRVAGGMDAKINFFGGTR